VLAPNIFQNLVDYISQGKIKPIVAHTFPLEEINTAQETFLQKQHAGKIVLKVSS
jgi:NADPH:quinone reductase-like Zn-dependent oxidoreductase